MSKSTTVSRCKTSFVAFLITAIAVIYVLLCMRSSSLLPGSEWASRYLNAIVRNRSNRRTSADDLLIIANNVSVSSSTSAATTDLLTAAPEKLTANKTGRYVSLSKGCWFFFQRCIGRLPTSIFHSLKELDCSKNLSSAIWHLLAIFFEVGSNT